jgi:hypothetical protein
MWPMKLSCFGAVVDYFNTSGPYQYSDQAATNRTNTSRAGLSAGHTFLRLQI